MLGAGREDVMSHRKAGSLGWYSAVLLILFCAASARAAGSPGAIELSASAYSVAPSAGGITITLERVGGSSGIAIATYATFDNTAVAGSDYTATSGALTWSDGDAAPKSFTVPITPGGAGGDSFTVALISAANAAFGSPIEASIAISAPTVSSGPGAIELSATAYSTAPSSGAVTIWVERVGGSSGVALATYATFDNTAVAGTDYTATSGALTWSDGDATPKSFTVPIAAGGAGGDSFTVALISASNAGFGSPLDASITISSASSSGGSVDVPPPAAAVGYNALTFGPAVTVGSNWFLSHFDSSAEATPASQVIQNPDGTVSLSGNFGGNGQISSAADIGAGWQGIAFGGGAYFEATLSFTGGSSSTSIASGWPSFWAMSAEHLIGPLQNAGDNQWPGQASDYGHFNEFDFFEYDVATYTGNSSDIAGSEHDWYGVWTAATNYQKVSTPYSQNVHATPAGTDFSTPHRYGFLWVPATATTQGYGQWYFDGVQVGGTLTWNQYSPADPPPPVLGTTAFSIADVQHFPLILGTGDNFPMTVYSVSVWQASAAGNLTQ
jgi:Calx-beta domain